MMSTVTMQMAANTLAHSRELKRAVMVSTTTAMERSMKDAMMIMIITAMETSRLS